MLGDRVCDVTSMQIGDLFTGFFLDARQEYADGIGIENGKPVDVQRRFLLHIFTLATGHLVFLVCGEKESHPLTRAKKLSNKSI